MCTGAQVSVLHAGAKSVQRKPGKMSRKAPLISRKDRPVMGLHSERDCVHTNALETIR